MKARSMTGFGAAEREGPRGRVRVELRSLNHRFLEVSINLPAALLAREAELKALVAERVRRARVDVWVSWEPRGDEGFRVQVNQALLGELHRALEEARLGLGIPGDVAIDVLTRYPEAVRIQPGSQAEDGFATVAGALAEALDMHDRARAAEGEALVRDVAARFAALEAEVRAVRQTGEAEPQRLAERLRERLALVLGDARLDPERLHQEVAYLAERCDVTEELVRLDTHLERARALLAGGDELGKALDFLLQEIGREVNTIGSKLRSPETSGHVLAMKAEIEKIREQARNLE